MWPDALQSARWLMALAVAVSVTVVAPWSVVAQDGGICPEPNDDPSAACTLASGTTVQSFIERPGDIDVYRVVASGAGRIQVDLTDLPADYDLYLADASGGVIGQSAHEGTAPESLQLAVQPRTYYVFVQADPAREIDASQPYTLTLTLSVGAGQQPVVEHGRGKFGDGRRSLAGLRPADAAAAVGECHDS